MFAPGSISFISDAYGGAASDRFITEDCGVVSKFNRNMVALVDRGFNVQDLLLAYHVTVAIPPFTKLKEKHILQKVQVEQAKTISRARIRVERAIGRLKEFKLLSHELPLNMLDLTDWIIAGAITNLQPPFVIE